MKLKIFIYVLLSMLIFSQSSLAIEAIDPNSACERFLLEKDKKNCLQKISQINPDSYLAAICQLQFDDKKFFECMSLPRPVGFNPQIIDKCSLNEFNDEERLNCLNTAFLQNFQKKMPSKKDLKRLPANKIKLSK